MKQRSVIQFMSNILMFSSALGIAWLMVRVMDLTWDRALLIQILWLTALNRMHQD